VSRVYRKCWSLDLSQPYGLPRPVTRIVFNPVHTRGISPSQGCNLHTESTQTGIHALSGIRTHPSVRAGEDGSCLRPRVHCPNIRIKLGKCPPPPLWHLTELSRTTHIINFDISTEVFPPLSAVLTSLALYNSLRRPSLVIHSLDTYPLCSLSYN
jgi:hypothetical protein